MTKTDSVFFGRPLALLIGRRDKLSGEPRYEQTSSRYSRHHAQGANQDERSSRLHLCSSIPTPKSSWSSPAPLLEKCKNGQGRVVHLRPSLVSLIGGRRYQPDSKPIVRLMFRKDGVFFAGILSPSLKRHYSRCVPKGSSYCPQCVTQDLDYHWSRRVEKLTASNLRMGE